MSQYNYTDDPLFHFYKKAFAMARVTPNEDSTITLDSSGKPMTVKGQEVILAAPIYDKKEARMVVHPLIESIETGESPFVERLREYYHATASMLIGMLMCDILIFGASPSEHSRASSDISDILLMVKDVDQTMVDCWVALSKQANTLKKASMFAMYPKAKATFGGRTYSRACVVTFPLFNELMKEERKVGTVSVRRKDREAFIAIFKYLLPGIGEEHTYSRGPVGDFGPTFTAMVASMTEVLTNVYEVAAKFKDFVPTYSRDFNLDLNLLEPLQDGSLITSIRTWRAPTKEVQSEPVASTQAPSLNAPVAVRPAIVNPRQSLQDDMAQEQARQELAREQREKTNQRSPVGAVVTPVEPETGPAGGRIPYSMTPTNHHQQGMYPAAAAPMQASNIITDAAGNQYIINPQGQAVPIVGGGMQAQAPQMDPRIAARMRQDQLRQTPAHVGVLPTVGAGGGVQTFVGPDGQTWALVNGQAVPLAVLAQQQQQMPQQVNSGWPGGAPVQNGWPGAAPAGPQYPTRQAPQAPGWSSGIGGQQPPQVQRRGW